MKQKINFYIIICSFLVFSYIASLNINSAIKEDETKVSIVLNSIVKMLSYTKNLPSTQQSFKNNSPGTIEKSFESFMVEHPATTALFIYSPKNRRVYAFQEARSQERQEKGISAGELETLLFQKNNNKENLSQILDLKNNSLVRHNNGNLYLKSQLDKDLYAVAVLSEKKLLKRETNLSKILSYEYRKSIISEPNYINIVFSGMPLFLLAIFVMLILVFFLLETVQAIFTFKQTVESVIAGKYVSFDHKTIVFKGLYRWLENVTNAFTKERNINTSIINSAEELSHDGFSAIAAARSCFKKIELQIEKNCLKNLKNELKRPVDLMNFEFESLSIVLEDLLRMDRKRPSKKEKINISPVVRKVIAGFKETIATPIQYTVNLPENLYIYADKKIILAIKNLMKNSQEHTSYKKNMWVNYKFIGDDYVTIMIKNEGSYLSKSEQKNILQRGITRRASGNGLGLTIVKNILNNEGASLEINSNKEKNTTEFSFILERYKNEKI